MKITRIAHNNDPYVLTIEELQALHNKANKMFTNDKEVNVTLSIKWKTHINIDVTCFDKNEIYNYYLKEEIQNYNHH